MFLKWVINEGTNLDEKESYDKLESVTLKAGWLGAHQTRPRTFMSDFHEVDCGFGQDIVIDVSRKDKGGTI